MLKINIIEYLAKRGQKVYSDSYLQSFTKEDLIDQIRCLEHNFAGEVWGSELLTKRLEKVCDYLKQQGMSLDEINDLLQVKIEDQEMMI